MEYAATDDKDISWYQPRENCAIPKNPSLFFICAICPRTGKRFQDGV